MIFKDVLNYEGLYQVSDTGIICSVDRLVNYSDGSSAIHKGKVLKPLYKLGYAYASFSKNGHGKHFPIHRIVAEVFIPNPDNKSQINHINGVKNDNRVENLEWCTPSENQIHAVRVLGIINGNTGKEVPLERRQRISESLKRYFMNRTKHKATV
jgi:hypothetical protein